MPLLTGAGCTPPKSLGLKHEPVDMASGSFEDRQHYALNLLLGGIPSIYYGQELGMTGTSGKFGGTDANEIPDREAFEWYKSDQGKGMAYWYKLRGPWKDKFNNDKPLTLVYNANVCVYY